MEDKPFTITETVDLGIEQAGEELCIPLWWLVRQLSEALALIPKEFQDTAVFTAEAYGDNASLGIRVTFTRPETAEESITRKAEEISRERSSRAHELAKLRELLRKYPDER